MNSLVPKTSPMLDDINPRQLVDFVNLFRGERLGVGYYRAVYAHALDPTLVIKIQQPDATFSNVREWDLWQEVRTQPRLAAWLAPCVAISDCGLVLIQKRTAPVLQRELPKQVPMFLTDLKRANWGRLGRRVVCHDYAINLSSRPVATLKKASFWEA